MHLRSRLLAGVAVVPVLVSLVVLTASGPSGGAPKPVANAVLARELAIETGKAKAPKWQQHPSSGAMYAVLQAAGVIDAQVAAAGPRALSSANTQGCQKTGVQFARPTRVNQDCSLRRQAEETIAINPQNPQNLIGGQNDSRVGFNHCGYDWSFDGGKTWGDQVPPFWQFILKDGHTADACSDPTATFDSTGNAYAGGILFDINSAASAIVVVKSNAGIGGAFYHSPVQGPFQEYSDDPVGEVASSIGNKIFLDKELMTADQSPGSPKADNVYMVYTRFNVDTGAGVGGDSPIFFSQSTDGGASWSNGIEISGSNGDICTDFSGESDPNACDQDQGADPVVGSDGTVYVSFGNGNTPTTGLNQHLVVSCPPSANCAKKASWTTPSKISDDFGTQPVGPDAATACSAGRQCLPPNGYRLDDFVEGSISVAQNGNLFFAWADYRNGQDSSTCPGLSPAASAVPPCNNDVFYAFSQDGGATWSSTRLVTPTSAFGESAQWQPWSSVSADGKSLWIAFYDRSHGNCESTGCNDITLAKVGQPATASPSFTYSRLTPNSMPNLVVANNPVQAGFLGDYMWVATIGNTQPYVIWAGTNGLHGTVEEDIYFMRGPVG